MHDSLGRQGFVLTRVSPNREFNDDVEHVLKLFHNHIKIYPNCEIDSESWCQSVNELIDAFDAIPDILQNKFFVTTTPVCPTPSRIHQTPKHHVRVRRRLITDSDLESDNGQRIEVMNHFNSCCFLTTDKLIEKYNH